MLAKKIYPRCAFTFKKFINSNPDYYGFYYILGKPKPFDVTLRDGLQTLSKEEQENYTLEKKMDLYHNIMFNYNPKNIEIGSVVSEKVLPIFKDSIKIFQNIQLFENSINELSGVKIPNKFMLVSNSKQLKKVINYTGINYFSFITSVSNQFQLKNTKQTLDESYNELYEIINELK